VAWAFDISTCALLYRVRIRTRVATTPTAAITAPPRKALRNPSVSALGSVECPVASTLSVRVVAIVDVKAPGSGEEARMHWENLERLRPQDEVKFVIADRRDYEWSREVVRARGLAARGPLLFSPVHGGLDPGLLAQWVLADGLPARVQVQLHKYLWPGVERGV